uniref:Uncharacterized protein n=1 Tax=Schistosoma mansoni TaxID=6183 RepID=A0A5K4FBH4_SCHMA
MFFKLTENAISIKVSTCIVYLQNQLFGGIQSIHNPIIMITQSVISQIENITTIMNTTILPMNLLSMNDTIDKFINHNEHYNNSSISTSQQTIIHPYKDLIKINNKNQNQIIPLNSSLSELNLIKTNSLVKNIRNVLDKPLAGLIVIGALFFTISILLGLVVLIFYKKRNTVFVYEKSQHGGLNSLNDRSIIIGQTMEARKIGSQLVMMHKHDSLYSFNNEEEEEEEEDSYNDSNVDDDGEYGEISFNNTDNNNNDNDDLYKTIFKEPKKASYILRSEYDLIKNPYCISAISCNYDQNELKKFRDYEQSYMNKMTEINKRSKSHGNRLSLNNGNIIRNPTFVLCPKHAQMMANRK